MKFYKVICIIIIKVTIKIIQSFKKFKRNNLCKIKNLQFISKFHKPKLIKVKINNNKNIKININN
jgi:hypothetical protein